MKTQEDLQKKATDMNNYLQLKVGSEPNDVIERIEMLSILISASGLMLADAKYLQDSVINGAISGALKENVFDKLSATALNKYINSLAKEQNYLVAQFDRINSAAVHQLDGLRSILSYRKSEFSTLSYQK